MKHHALSLSAQLKPAANGQRWPLGTVFTPAGRKHPRPCTVIDYLVTRNLAGEVVATRYVARHTFCGQEVINSDVLDVTIARGNPQLPPPEPSW